jgi:hypothetical protein
LGGGFSGSVVGYIDSAVPLTQFRLRFDAAYDSNRPDRAEFFYAKYRSNALIVGGNPAAPATDAQIQAAIDRGGLGKGGHGPGDVRQAVTGSTGGTVTVGQLQALVYATAIGKPGVTVNQAIIDPKAPGLPLPETRVDYQDITSYLEVALNERFSGFVEVPVRFLNPEQNANTAGLADMNAGFKWAFLYCPDRVASFQFRTWIPTGAASHGLGTNHVTLEPALLLNQRVTDHLVVEAELHDYIPIGGTDFEGNVLRYGVGASYLVFQRCNVRVLPVIEFVGWTVLSGKEAVVQPNAIDVQDARGDTIVNGKFGVRIDLGPAGERGWGNSDLYVGYGRALTGDVWYKDIVRLEYRLRF